MQKNLIHVHVEGLRTALINGDQAVTRQHRDWLTCAIAGALLDQDIEAMRILRVELADLISLADHYASEGSGERWRALCEVLQLCCDTFKPLEQVRLAQPNRLSGLILRHIGKESGITPSLLAEKLEKKRSHISNELAALEKEGLIHRLSEGRNTYLYISGIGRSVLAGFVPLSAATVGEAHSKRVYPHADPQRIRQPPIPLSGLVRSAA